MVSVKIIKHHYVAQVGTALTPAFCPSLQSAGITNLCPHTWQEMLTNSDCTLNIILIITNLFYFYNYKNKQKNKRGQA